MTAINPDNVARDACSILAILCHGKSASEVNYAYNDAVEIAAAIHVAAHREAAKVNGPDEVRITVPEGVDYEKMMKNIDDARKEYFSKQPRPLPSTPTRPTLRPQVITKDMPSD